MSLPFNHNFAHITGDAAEIAQLSDTVSQLTKKNEDLQRANSNMKAMVERQKIIINTMIEQGHISSVATNGNEEGEEEGDENQGVETCPLRRAR